MHYLTVEPSMLPFEKETPSAIHNLDIIASLPVATVGTLVKNNYLR